MGELSNLIGLGESSENILKQIGIESKSDLETMGAVNAFIKLKKEYSKDLGLKFLYAMLGALRGEYWVNIPKEEQEKLIYEADGFKTLAGILKAEGTDIEL